MKFILFPAVLAALIALANPVQAQSTRALFSRPGLSIGAYHYNFFDGLFNASYQYVGDTVLCGDTLLVYALLPDKSYKAGIKIEGAKVRGASLSFPCLYNWYYYDFDLQVGDVFDATAQNGSFTVFETGEKNLLNGEKRRYLRLKGNSNPSWIIEWVEGIGDITQGLFPGYDFEGYYRFVCAKDSSGDFLYGQDPPPDLVCDSLLCPIPSVHFSWSVVDKTGHFNSLISDADVWWWDFGDGQTSTEAHPTHVYDSPGCYEVQLYARPYCSLKTTAYHQSVPVCISPDWSQVSSPSFPNNEKVWDLAFPSPDTGWAKTQNHLFKTVDGGLSWQLQDLPASQPGSTRSLYGFYMANSHTGIISCGYNTAQSNNANFLITTDGEHWTPSFAGTTQGISTAAIKADGLGYAMAGIGNFFRTRDFGQTWESTQISINLSGLTEPEKIVPLQGDTVYVLGSIKLFSDFTYYVPLLLRSYDQGGHWDAVLLPDPPGYYVFHDMYFFDGHNGWLPGFNGALLHTRDGGDTWEELPYGVPLTVGNIHFFDALNGWAGGGVLILHTKDGGQNWEKETCGFSDYVISIVAASANSALATTYNNQLWQYAPTDDPLCEASSVMEQTDPATAVDWLLVPNPAGDYIELDRKRAESQAAFHVLLFNHLGQPLLERRFPSTPARLDVSALKPGMYALQISDGNADCRTLRFVVLR